MPFRRDALIDVGPHAVVRPAAPSSTGPVARPGSRPIRVLHTLRSFGVNGITNVVLRTVGAFDPRRTFSAVCAIYDMDHLADAFRARGVEPLVLGYRDARSVVPAVRQLVRLLRHLEIDVVHANQTIDLMLAGVAARLCGIPVVTTLHWQARSTPERPWSRSKTFVRLLSDRWLATRIITVSAATRDSFVQVHGRWFPAERVHVVHPGLDLREQSIPTEAERVQLRKELGIAGASPVLLNVGRLDPAKGQKYLLPMMQRVREKCPLARLLIVGDGALRDELAAAITDHGLDDAVRLLGRRLDIDALLSVSDVLILSSVTEAAPLPVLEAGRAGKPVVATRVGGVPEMVDEGVSGFVVPPADPAALADAALRIAHSPGMAERMGAAARQIMEERFDIAKSAEMLDRIYRSLT